ncbi:glycosyl transferase family, a/b domain-containing protein [Dunaliella salina]|uniref:Glycosyl transferase family, a/b domain-containing protein n=1 Tax=Dunaliella salina TaxID=3046 RepID=A0ABQ7GM16_DUNSA|nr:glycosyl transferase family, a/b domain-containing protein [Dunaliella salina]|eukprot:KAF5835659.1 glycosyl transferase family, a/b domain-containing protein [Dunaliella salina]
MLLSRAGQITAPCPHPRYVSKPRGTHARITVPQGHLGLRHKSRLACRAAGMQIREVLEHLIERKDLTEQQSEAMLNTILDDFSAEQAAALLVLLRAKGETPEEIAGMARAMLGKALTVESSVPVVDIVGTGGDGIGSVNISTGASIVAAAAGAHIAKTGNRSVSSMCGSADVLENKCARFT